MSAKSIKITKTIGIVAEYNPFHNGHAYQINQIKNMFPESVIISVMSGNLVQRGEFALFSKYERAKTAVLNGVDVVFELLPIYSSAPANLFAAAAVYVMHMLGGIDYICFGSECGDLELLDFAAEKTESDKFKTKLREYIKTNKNIGYPKSVSKTFKNLYANTNPDVIDIFSGSNNILAVEYIKALKALKSEIKPMTIRRLISDKSTVSASYIRNFLHKNPETPERLSTYMPENAYTIFADLIKSDKFADTNNISSALISHINRLNPEEITKYAEISGGMEHKIKKAAEQSFDYNTLIRSLEAKHNTSSSVRRMILNVFFEITRDMQKKPPEYTNLLAANQKGRQFLNSIRKSSQIKIITKPAHINTLNILDNINIFADNVYKLALMNHDDEINALKEKPYILD